ncbi:MAG: AAA family ATPase [Candidatus Nanopelagicales bacterium]|nr:AAA family ATPase [Candidatus Nanopelagicales bacterium]MDZ4250094.1 AAA family ATPase [Candidatus Nanopelagicales bacterium]
MTAFDKLAGALTATITGDTARARCPAHDSGSTNVLDLRRIEGSALIHCHAGCETTDVLASIGLTMADLYDDPRGARYDYTDDSGAVIRSVHRSPGKDFRQTGETKRTSPLFHLTGVTEAVKNGEPVYICEGEKDCLALESVGLAATCNPGGAGKWNIVDQTPLTGAHVVIVTDRDEPGTRHARDVKRHLTPIAASVRAVQSAAGKDAADHIAAGLRADDFAPLDLSATATAKYRFVNWGELLAGEHEPPDWVIPGVLPVGASCAIYSAAGEGKSLLMLDWAVRVAIGSPIFDDPIRSRTVLYLDLEQSPSILRNRLEAFQFTDPEKLGRLHYSLLGEWEPLDTAEGGRRLLEAAQDVGAEVVIVDTLSRAVRGLENDSDTALAQYRHTVAPLRRAGIAYVRLDHSGKDPQRGQRGSSAKAADVDLVYRLALTDKDTLTLRREKDRLGLGDPDTLAIRRTTGEALTHESISIDSAREAKIDATTKRLDELAVPADAGRAKAGDALRSAGFPVRNKLLAEVVRRRKLSVGGEPVPRMSLLDMRRTGTGPPTPPTGKVGTGGDRSGTGSERERGQVGTGRGQVDGRVRHARESSRGDSAGTGRGQILPLTGLPNNPIDSTYSDGTER